MENNDQILDQQFQEEEKEELVLASRGQRFANFIIDRIAFYIIFIALSMLVALIIGPEILDSMSNINRFADYLLTALFMFVYYLLSESLMKGRTIGKLLTKTCVVDEYGRVPDFSVTLKRTACRFVPFDAFSFLGEDGWHDNWSGTRVIEVSKKRFV
ncbi:MAG: RDD family protein [Saprospiraceae bacterium]|nr:RDD family protein [Saprospiraceae bacterium]